MPEGVGRPVCAVFCSPILSTPGGGEAEAPVEVVRYPVDSVPGPDHADLERFAALVVGPGLSLIHI